MLPAIISYLCKAMKRSRCSLWPLTKSFQTQYNGNLQVTWSNGRKVLNSLNANYSYGALQEVMDRGLAHIRAKRNSPVLLLCLGGGSVIPLLRKKYNYSGKITAVEIDPEVIEIALQEFKINEHQPLEIHCADAEAFVKNEKGQFGLIIIDLFLDLEVPLKFFSAEFWKNIAPLLAPQGVILFNAGIDSAHQTQIEALLKNVGFGLIFKKIEAVYDSNTLIFAEKFS